MASKQPTVAFTLRIPKNLNDRMFSAIAATEGKKKPTRSGLIIRALEFYLHVLSHAPSMLKGYDVGKDKLALRFEEMQGTK